MAAYAHEMHIGQADVEKIAIGQGKFLYHISDRFFINTLDGDGRKIWQEIQPGQRLSIGKDPLTIPSQLFYGKERITLNAYDVVWAKTLRKGFFHRYKRIFCNHLSFRAQPGTLTAIMGPSGAGKTVLLNLLSGYTSRPDHGAVILNDMYDVHRDRQMLGRTIGYVPQDDTLIPHLKVGESLDYCFRLRYAGVEADLKAHIIRDACRKAGFPDRELEKLLHNRIGSPDDKTLSGGERKRVNIAHELVRNPLLLFLDEPTSGLSSVDADKVIASLRALCDATKITIVLTIHQPSSASFQKLDNLLVLNRGGNVAYFGAAQDALVYFQDKIACPATTAQNPAEYILDALENWTTRLLEDGQTDHAAAEHIAAAYHADPRQVQFPQFADVHQEQPQAMPPLSTSFVQQLLVLLRRNQSVSRADKKTRLFQLLQPIVIAALLLCAFAWYARDYANEDLFAKVGYYLTDQTDRQQTIFMQQDVRQAKIWAYAQTPLVSEGAANRQAAVFFLLIASCIWFGVINACKEIVDERAVLQREAKSTLRLASYLAAKVVFMAWICAKQTILLLSIVILPNVLVANQRLLPASWIGVKYLLVSTQLLPQVTLAYLFAIWGLLWLTSVLASWLGLCISALAPNQKFALTVVPLVIIPQLLFGGLIRPIKDMDHPETLLLTPQALQRVQSLFPAEMFAKLQALYNQPFQDQKGFLSEVRTLIGSRAVAQFKDILIQQARMPSVVEPGKLLHNVMPQKWAFKAILLYHAFGEPNVLKKNLDFDRYREYEYIRFDKVHLFALFFEDDLSTSQPAQQMFFWTLIGLVGWHILWLLAPTYWWLRKTLRQ